MFIPARFATVRRLCGGLDWCARTGVVVVGLGCAAAAAGPVDPMPMIVPAALQPASVAPTAPAADSEIKARLDGAAVLTIAGEPVRTALLRRFYAAHGYQPVWAARAAPTAALWNVVARAAEHGLDPAGYHAAVLAKPAGLSPIDRDLLLSDAFLSYAEALARGAVPPDARMDDEDLAPAPVDVVAVLDAALSGADPAAAIEALAPHSPAYAALRRAYQHYRAIVEAGGWPRVVDGQRALLQQRLAAEGYLSPGYASAAMDEATLEAVRAFQRHHGIDPDGKLGPATLVELNVSAADRVQQIAVNLERLRWLPRTLPTDRLWVNTATAQLRLYRGDKVAFTTRVVVGETDKQTPEFRASVVSVLYNPPWNVPYSIATKEILPKLTNQPDYLDKHRMTMRSNGGIQQLPGPGNALGQLKFEMPNRYDVYLHDTPLKALFGRDNRRQSHGCVRVQNPRELAALLLDEPSETINKGIALGYTNRKSLATPVPVFVVYQTAIADSDGTVEFRRDSYQRDGAIARGLARTRDAPVAERNPAGERRG